jgi:hypothetical protein
MGRNHFSPIHCEVALALLLTDLKSAKTDEETKQKMQVLLLNVCISSVIFHDLMSSTVLPESIHLGVETLLPRLLGSTDFYGSQEIWGSRSTLQGIPYIVTSKGPPSKG